MIAHPPLLHFKTTVLLALATSISCWSGESPAGPQIHGIALAGGKPIQVRDTDPPGTEQGTVDLQVRVLGSGFEAPARVRLLLNGDPTGVVTSAEAEFVSDKELITTIIVAEDATVGLWDVEVELLARGRKGIGIELFEVQTKCQDPSYCNQNEAEPNAQAGWIGTTPDDAMVSDRQGVILKESGRTITVQGDFFSVAMDFDAVRALPVVIQDEGGTQLPVDQCVLEIPDLSGFHPSVTPEGIANTLKSAFYQDALTQSHLEFTIGTRKLGQQDPEHILWIRPLMTSEEVMNILNPDGTLNTSADLGFFRWGGNGSGTTWGKDRNVFYYPRYELIGGSLGDTNLPRVFRISRGTVRTVGGLGDGGTAVLLCDVPAGDAAIVTIDPL